MAVTLQDVARASGVSKATVSRVLNDDPRISAATRQRVRAALDALGYRGLGRRAAVRTGDVAFLLSDPLGPVHEDLFFNEVLRGVVAELEAHGYHTLLAHTDGRLDPSGHLPSVVERVDGVIAAGAGLQPALVRALIAGPVPVVLIGRYLRGRGFYAVLPDNEEGGRLATEHLLALGRRRIAFLGGPMDTNVYRDRLAGYQLAHAEAGLTPDPALFRPVQRNPDDVVAQTLDLFATDAPPDAIFAADDWLALQVLHALRERGLRVPEDVAVVGYADVPLAALADPPLTTVHVPKRRLGRAAAKLLHDVLTGQSDGPVQIIVSPHLVVRASTGGTPMNPTPDAPLPGAPATGGQP